MDQFYISYHLPSTPSSLPISLSTPILPSSSFQSLQHQSQQISLSPLITSYISSLLIALRLHPSIVSTSISPRAVGDVRSYIRDMGLREGCEGWVNAEGVRWAV